MIALDGNAAMSVDTSAPLVTVITATFNSSRTLQITLHSLLNQDFHAFEAWVVGDACTPTIVVRAKSFPSCSIT
jgi:glycosyltransferase involved in cell wall biosynthesis